MNIAIVGHVDHGKSTLIGRLLYDSEALPEDKLAEIQKLLEEYKRRFEFAYFLDSFEEELREERTIDTTRVIFGRGEKLYTIVDVPGHKEFIKNMLTGASHAEAAILVVSALEGVEEQTRRHSFLLSLLGVKKLIVAVNKMDLVDFREERFSEVREEVRKILAPLGFGEVRFVPISAMEGDNVYRPSSRMSWYGGPTLIEALEELEPEEEGEKPLRFAVQDIYKIDSREVVVGRVESGILRRGEELVFRPSGACGRVESILFYPCELEEARAGDSIGLIAGCRPRRGDVGGHPRNPPSAVTRFLGEVVVLEGDLQEGDELEIKCGTRRARCEVFKLLERINSETGEVMERNPHKIEEGEAATLIFKTEPVVVERFSEIPELGRFVLARGGRNMGAGIVLSR